MSQELTLPAPAKINLSLQVIRKRDDGFHEVETVIAPISLADELTFKQMERGGLQFSCNQPELPVDDSNLVVSAVRRLERHRKRAFNVSIHLEKRVPFGAGLGGGSSDAATTLQALNQMFELEYDRLQLAKLAAEMGSDIPFFLYQTVCSCKGRGEEVEPIAFDQSLPLLLIKPDFEVPTPEAYKNWKDSKEIPEVFYGPQYFSWGTLVNGLERPVFAKHIILADLKMWLLDQPEVAGALMSGSGSTMIALLRELHLAEALEERVRRHYGENYWIQACQTLI